jgi:hypothetical protein
MLNNFGVLELSGYYCDCKKAKVAEEVTQRKLEQRDE